ncbi:MAG: DNA-binding protein [Elusimicrobia bacterium]|nr:DNA-binding protein [Elusimicrobiota bacterium]
MSPQPIEPERPGVRREVLERLKMQGRATVSDLAEALGVTREAVRRQLLLARREGWVRRMPTARRSPGAGRPTSAWALTEAGEHLFPKAYDAAAVEVIDAVADGLGPGALTAVLSRLADARFERLRPAMEGKDLAGRLKALKRIYGDDDPYISVESRKGAVRLVERNCPLLGIALRRPALCSVTVSALSRLLGCRVTREERFQEGHGRCVFAVHPEEPVDPAASFAPEPGPRGVPVD